MRQGALFIIVLIGVSAFIHAGWLFADEVETARQQRLFGAKISENDEFHVEWFRRTELFAKRFGNSVDFSLSNLQGSLTRVSPYSTDERLSLRSRTVVPAILKWSRRYFQQTWFTPDWAPTDSEVTPLAVAAPWVDRSARDSGCLYYHWKRNEVSFDVSESAEGVLVEISNPDLPWKEGVPAATVAEFLSSVFELDYYKYENNRQIRVTAAEYLNLPDRVINGSVFGSETGYPPPTFFQRWQFVVIGFCASDRLSVVMYRPNRYVDRRGNFEDGKGPRGERRSETIAPPHLGRYRCESWLEEGVLDVDGMTPLSLADLRKLVSNRNADAKNVN